MGISKVKQVDCVNPTISRPNNGLEMEKHHLLYGPGLIDKHH